MRFLEGWGPGPPHTPWYLWARAVRRLCPGCQPRAPSSGSAGMWGLLADVGWALLCTAHSGCRSLPLREVLLAGFCLEPRTPGHHDRNQAISCLFSLAVVESILTSDNDSDFTFDPFIRLWRNNSVCFFICYMKQNTTSLEEIVGLETRCVSMYSTWYLEGK